MAVRRALMSLVLAGLVTTTACGPSGGEPKSAAPKQKVDQRLHDLLPAKIKKSGRLAVAQGNNYPPLVFLDSDNKTVIGMEPDLMKAIGEVLGVKIDFSQTSFDSLIAGVHAHRYDLAIQAMLDKPERREHITFVDYFKTSSSVLVHAQDATKIGSLGDLCGKSVAVEQGTAQVDDAKAQSDTCRKAGKPAVKTLVFPDTVGCIQALSTSRADAFVGGTPTVVYHAGQSGGKLKEVGKPYRYLPYGILVDKQDTALVKAVQGALSELMRNGTYRKILKTWKLSSGALDRATVNGGAA
ncbi:ABC transporter substrate-binding protein [Streptomyces sparsogenes]|uniref:ABC transporter substrate-binding protein n=1 Tax=Streptomyces sparsogenes TaxID=67365 RepID=UPI0033C251CC